MNSQAPLALELQLTKGPGLSARLVNQGPAARPVLHDLRLQPSRLVLRNAAGDTLEPFDRRALMKFDNTLYCDAFKALPPGQALELGAERFEKSGGAWKITWGPYEYDALPAGRYNAWLAWESVAAECQESADATPRPVAGVWLGTTESNPVEVTLK